MRRHQRRAIFLVALTLGFSGATPAEKINKCTDNSGKVIYQKESCDTQQVEEKKDIDPDRNCQNGTATAERSAQRGPRPSGGTVDRYSSTPWLLISSFYAATVSSPP